MGRKTVPTAIKAAMGNPGKRPLNKNEPGRDVAVEIPVLLIDDEVAVDEFLRLATLLASLGMLKNAWERVVIRYAKVESRKRKVEDALKNEWGNTGPVDQRVWLLKSLEEQQTKMEIELGLTPSAMAKLFKMTPGAAAIVGKGYAEQKLKQIDLGERKEDDWQPPIEVAG